MRTIHNLDLLEEVIKNPYGTIGQRSFKLYKSFSSPYDRFTKVHFDEHIESTVENMPSMEEYVTNQIGENNVRTVLFDYYMGWFAEDTRELFELCIEKIKEYEKTHPLDRNSYLFRLRPDTGNLDLRKHLKHMILRPGMYGFDGFAGMRAYLDGYFKFKSQYQLHLSEYETKLLSFIEYWKAKVNQETLFETWDRPFRLELMGTTDFSRPSLSWEFERFEIILEEELAMKLEDPYSK